MDDKMNKVILTTIGVIVVGPIMVGSAARAIGGVAKVLHNSVFNAKMKRREKKGDAVNIDGQWYEVQITTNVEA